MKKSNKVNNNFKGAHSELIACVWLMGQGYEVYRNISPSGPIDIIAIKDNIISKFDVKSCPDIDKARPTGISKDQIEQGIQPLYVDLLGKCVIGIKIKCRSCQNEFEGLAGYCSDYCRIKGRIEWETKNGYKPRTAV